MGVFPAFKMGVAVPLILQVLAGLYLTVPGNANEPPVWDPESYNALVRGVPEQTAINSELAQLRCIDPDGDQIQYSLESGNAVSVSRNGVVRLIAELDFEDRGELGYDLRFGCVDVDSDFFELRSPIPASTEITVIDSNDNQPTFNVDNNEGYSFFVSESAPVGFVLNPYIKIEDADRGDNAVLESLYIECDSRNQLDPAERAALSESSLATCEKFTLSFFQETEGVYNATLTLRSSLDYETRQVYTSSIVAVNGGPNASPGKLTSTTNIQINVIDAQDVLPVFTNPGESTSVSEGAPVGTTLLNFGISARDGDTGDKRPVAISIIQDSRDAFDLTTAALESSDTGVYSSRLIVKNQLDREQLPGGSAYTFVVRCVELDKTTLQPTTATATATYSVFVADINDQAPTFENSTYFINVTEVDANSAGNQPIQITGLHIYANDFDEPSNARYNITVTQQSFPVYSITPGVTFTGQASLFLRVADARYLDYDNPLYRNQVVVLTAREIDTALRLSGSTTISINLQDVNDNTPVFNQSEYRFSFSENIRTFPQEIGVIQATDRDSGLNGDVGYQIVGQTGGVFNIDQSSGRLSLTGAVDFETIPQYVFLVVASDRGVPPRSTQVQVIVNVNNYNDQGPRFLLPSYQTSANETSLRFFNPIQVNAVDDDEVGPLGITYRIISGQSPNDAFVIGSTNGNLTLRNYLDYNDTIRDSNGTPTGRFILTVEASDNAQPPQTNTVQVIITVIDENNHGPVLQPREYLRELSELAVPGTSIAQISGTDEDAGNFGRITYRIGQGLSDNFFVNPDSGLIEVGQNPTFDFDETSSYRLLVIASDGGAPQLSATATVNIQILDENNKDPEFLSEVYLFSRNENTPVGSLIGSIPARDLDGTKNLEYSIDTGNVVAIDSDGVTLTSTSPYDYTDLFATDNSGNITLKNPLDRSRAQEISFTLSVRDTNTEQGAGIDSTRITVIVTGEARTDLTFDPINTLFMNENSEIGYEPITVTARDPNNRAVSSYRELPPLSDYFNVNPITGLVFLTRTVDYETDTTPDHIHRVVIGAYSANNQESATVTVTVSILDVNDNAPVFGSSTYFAEVSENARFPTEIASLYAEDEDSTSFGPLHFSINGGLDSDNFEIFEEPVPAGSRSTRRAQVIVARNRTLDYNRRSRYTLDLLVNDNSKLQASNVVLSSRATLIVNVIDENNHAPTFGETSRNLSVPETAEVGLSIATVIATDSDSGRNGQISYSLERLDLPNSDEGLNLFTIGITGTISVIRPLLGRGNTIYPLQVRARDRGVVPNSGVMNVSISVQSTEDDDGNPKWLSPANGYNVTAPEETPGHVLSPLVFNVNPRTGTGISYRLSTIGTDDDGFAINSTTGQITMVGNLDRERQEIYNLLVYAQDTSDPDNLRTGRQIVVILTDKNDNAATFTNPQGYASCVGIDRPLVVQVRENTPANVTVYQLRACDPDLNPVIRYTLYNLGYNGSDYCSRSNLASALRVTEDGRLVTRRLIDFEQTREFSMCVRAESVAKRRKRSFDLNQVNPSLDNVAYIQVLVMDENDNGPRFPARSVVAVIQTLPEPGPVLTLDAVDVDGDDNNAIVYLIQRSAFYPAEGQAPSTAIGVFTLRDSGAIYPSLPSYQQFSGGRFELTVEARDSLNNSLNDTQRVSIYVYQRGQAMKVILNLRPAQSFEFGEDMIRDLDAVSAAYSFSYLQISEHRSADDVNPERTDICFLVVETTSGNILNIPQMIDLLEGSNYEAILNRAQYQTIDRGACYPSDSSENNVRWRRLWWVLVAVAIFVFICCVICIVLAVVLYNRYKRYMKTRQTYLVSD